MSEQNLQQARMALFDYFVDTLVDLADPEDDDRDLAQDDMMQVVKLLFEGINLVVTSAEGSDLTVSLSL